MNDRQRYWEQIQNAYYQAKLRTIEVLREASNHEHVRVDSVVIDQGRNPANLIENHIIMLRSNDNDRQIVSIRHDVFMNEEKFYSIAAPMLAEAVKKLAA